MDNEQLKSKFEAKYNEYGKMLYKIAFLYFGIYPNTLTVK